MPTRRSILKRSSQAATAALGLPLWSSALSTEQTPLAHRKLKVVVVGGHPDDPESSCGGTMARYSELGHQAVALYLTRGEAGIAGKSYNEAAAIRTAEAQEACRILQAVAVFAGQVDGRTEVNGPRYNEFRQILEAQQPDIVFAPWPVDTHRDHRAASLLAHDTWLQAKGKFALYYTEVETGSQTQNFAPTVYVDITATEPRKRAACFAHASQNPAGFYSLHEMMNRFRGMECGCTSAEAFVRHVQNGSDLLSLNG